MIILCACLILVTTVSRDICIKIFRWKLSNITKIKNCITKIPCTHLLVSIPINWWLILFHPDPHSFLPWILLEANPGRKVIWVCICLILWHMVPNWHIRLVYTPTRMLIPALFTIAQLPQTGSNPNDYHHMN